MVADRASSLRRRAVLRQREHDGKGQKSGALLAVRNPRLTMSVGDDLEALRSYYELGEERERLSEARGALEFERSKELIERFLPPIPAVIADIGGGPGRYALWLAELGYEVRHRDIVPLHVSQLDDQCGELPIDTAVGDARALDLQDGSVDAVLLLGPLYHLGTRADRILALREARRIARPGGYIFAAAISRWAARLDGILAKRMYRSMPETLHLVAEVERTGVVPPLGPSSFLGYSHRPMQLGSEVRAAGLSVVSLVGIEGAASLLVDLEERAASAEDWSVVLDTARATESVPELLGIGPHLLAICRRSND